ncbi:tectonic-1 [Elgaria multicarinata webbii]|uniref:tectonic-1 n=1 Tax=Elgaria multicarinata webbii TaxID=159646 RepID=UPI002FCD4CCC
MGWGAPPPPPLPRPFAVLLLLLPISSCTAVPTSATPSPATPPSATSRDGTTVSGTESEGTPGSGATTDLPLPSTPGPSQGSPGLGEETPSGASIPVPTSPIVPATPGPTAEAASFGPSPAGSPGPSGAAVPETTPHRGPWPAPVTDVAKLCTCDLLVDQCDINCCCDPVCTAADFSLFTACSVPVVIGDRQLCRQEEALYSINPAAHPPERIFQLADKVNPSVFCIQTANYKAALSFQDPEIPTSQNFGQLLQQFGGDTFDAENDLAPTLESQTQRAADANKTSRYEFKDPIQTSDGFLRLPAPLFLSQCAHSNPAGFLLNQAVKCNTVIESDKCTAIPALSMQFYTNSSILAVPNSSQMVTITIQSVTVQTPEGLRMRLANEGALLLPELNGQFCNNSVLEARYLVTFTEAGEIISAAVSLVLGTVNMAAFFVQQTFEIRFIQQDTHPVSLSGSPGYVVGLPIKAGVRSTASGVIQSANEGGQLTIMKSTSGQDCLAVEGSRTPVLFGYNMMSGCLLRITKDMDCRLVAPALLDVLKGQTFPDCVASFGDSLPQNGLDWVQIYYNVTKPTTCEIPVSFDLEVKWTKYGSLVNPQAKIVSITVTVVTAALPQVDPGSPRTIQILSSATFSDVSAPAEPGYKARPTIEAHLPFDFFFPFV